MRVFIAVIIFEVAVISAVILFAPSISDNAGPAFEAIFAGGTR